MYSYLLYYVRRGYRITAIMLPSQGRNESSTLSTRTNERTGLYAGLFVGIGLGD